MKHDPINVESASHFHRPDIAVFHCERSRCIDGFSAIEEAVIALLAILDIKAGSEPFSHKLDALRKAKANHRFSKERLQKLSTLIPACETLNRLRNDIVHSQLQIAIIGDVSKACFVNTRDCTAGSQSARLFAIDGLSKLHSDIARMVVELNQALINPPSSPPPPLPAAAGGP